MTKTSTFFNSLIFVIFSIAFISTSCNKNNKLPIFKVDAPGSKVISMYADSTPQVVYHYKLDEAGKTTNEKIGEVYYYENKQEYVLGGLKNNKRDGRWVAYFRNGKVQTDAFYLEGVEHGNYIVYQENGNPLFKGHYYKGICDGTWSYYDENGKETRKIIADKNTIACEYCEKCLRLKGN